MKTRLTSVSVTFKNPEFRMSKELGELLFHTKNGRFPLGVFLRKIQMILVKGTIVWLSD